jgi:hypothetical protein
MRPRCRQVCIKHSPLAQIRNQLPGLPGLLKLLQPGRFGG